MPLFSLPGHHALAQLRRNALSRWPDGRRDGSRLDGVVLPVTRPGFRMHRGDAVLTIGSCFARNIETRLQELGFRVPARTIELPEEERGSDTANDILNKYNPQSIVNELVWAFEQPFPEAAYLQLGGGLWHDPHLAGNAAPVSLKRLGVRRALVTRLFRGLPRCRYVIVTLGLVEAWYDLSLDLYLNGAPPREAVKREPDRFRLDVLDHDEIVASLDRMWGLIRAHGHGRVRLLLTVSPVPLKATYTGQDVLVANMYSKSLLRAAVGTFIARHPEVDYFPSYEAAMLTPRPTAFLEDNRHVAPELVNAIIDRVVATYVEGAPAPDGEGEADEAAGDASPVAVQVRHHLKMGRVAHARRLLARLARSGDFAGGGYDEFSFRYVYAKTLMDLGAALEAEMQLVRAVEIQPESALAHYALGRVLSRLQRPLRAEEAFRRTVALDPDNLDARLRLARTEARNGKLPEAEQAVLAALARDADHAEAIALLRDIRAAASGTWRADESDRFSPVPPDTTSWSDRLARMLRPGGPDKPA